MNANLDFHALALDGVFTGAPGDALAFHPRLVPRDAEVAAALAAMRHRVQRLLVRHGLKPADDAMGRSPVLAGIVGVSIQERIPLRSRSGRGCGRSATSATRRPRCREPGQAHLDGFDLHAACGCRRTIAQG